VKLKHTRVNPRSAALLSRAPHRSEIELCGFPPGLEKVIRRDLEACAYLIPPWCRFLTMTYKPEGDSDPDSGALMSCWVDPEYRQTCIHVYPGHFDTRYSDDERHQALTHELLHITISPIGDFARREFDRLLSDAPMFKAAQKEQLRQRVEAAVQDLSIILSERIPALRARRATKLPARK
jgi:hypothetical protein